jgi:hypothetical protein
MVIMYLPIKKSIPLTLFCLVLLLSGCKDDDFNKFDKSADERIAEAKANLKSSLVDPAHGWKLLYTPQEGYGSFLVLLDFQDDNKVTIKTDLGADDGKFYEQTVGYRIDSSLGLELIMENYSFFAYLFEFDRATFGAEFEFNYVRKNENGSLLFSSKSDASNPTQLLFEEATENDLNALGLQVAQKLTTMTADLHKITTSLQMTYTNKDLIFYMSLQESYRVLTISSASRKSNTANTQQLNFTTGYYLKNDSIVFDTPLAGTFVGIATSLKGVQVNGLENTELNLCADPIPLHAYRGVTSAGDNVLLETSVADASGATFTDYDFFSAPPANVAYLGESAYEQVTADINTPTHIQLYYNYSLGDGSVLNAIGFRIQNPDGTITFALWEFVPILEDNNLKFNFAPEISQFGDAQTSAANLAAVQTYIEHLTDGGTTYVFRYSDGVYEFSNPCTGWSTLLISSQ